MNKSRSSIFRAINFFIFALIAFLSVLFIFITYFSATDYYQATTQRLNKDVAQHIATYSLPFDKKGLNKKVADSVFHEAMVLSPSAEIYFLDTGGNVIYYDAPDSAIKLLQIPLTNIYAYLQAEGTDYIKGPDPKNPSRQEVFSAAEVISGKKKLGYIYVILASKEYRNVTQMLFASHATGLLIKFFVIVLIVTIIVSFLYVRRLRRNFTSITNVLTEFQKGNYAARFKTPTYNEFTQVTESFNTLTDLLVYNINRLKNSEQERKSFIAAISHDLRTPLAIARGYMETLVNEINKTPEDRRQEFIQVSLKKIQQIEVMVMQLFELSKMESFEFKPAKEPFIFSDILLEIIDSYSKTAAAKNIHLKCINCLDNTAWINADVRMMERVLQNLSDNAIKFTPENGTINVMLERNNDELALYFTNTNYPLKQEEVKPFAFKETLVNAGLGLSIVRKILELHQYGFSETANLPDETQFIIRMKITEPTLQTIDTNM